MSELRQLPFFAPNVNGWPTGTAWLHAGTLTTWSRIAIWLVHHDDGSASATTLVPTVRRLHAEGSRTTGGDLALGLAGLHDVSPQTLQAVRDYANAGAWDHWRAAQTMALVLECPEFYVN